nr:DUF1949 domain-containing protein [Anaerobranca californiensis]
MKLGSGGLIRAYAQSAKAGIVKAKKGYYLLMNSLEITFDYHYHGRIENFLLNYKYVKDIIFTDKVTVKLLLEDEEIEEFKKAILNITAGSAEIKLIGKEYVFVEERENG